MNLRLPYIPARDYQAFYKDQLGIEVDKKTCREVAKRARRIEQKVLGSPDVEFLKSLHKIPDKKPNNGVSIYRCESITRDNDLPRDSRKDEKSGNVTCTATIKDYDEEK